MKTIKTILNNTLFNNLRFDFKQIFRAFQYRNYRYYYIGQGVSLIGTWMQRVAMSWLVYRLTHSPFLLGVVGFSSEIPIFLAGPVAGVLIDRWNRRKVLIITQILAMIQAFVLTALVFTHQIQVWHIIALSAFMGLINAFDMPGRQSFIVEIVEKKDDLGNAIALNSSMFNLARLIGPSVAGILIATAGEAVCFLVNGISYLSAIYALYAIRLKPKQIKPIVKNVLRELKQGFSYAYNFLPIRAILILLIVISFFAFPYIVLMPVIAKDILKGGANTMGFLMGGAGIGALIGALILAARKSVRGLGKIIPIAGLIFGVGLIALSFSRVFALSVLILIFTGGSMMMLMAVCNTVLQTIVDDDKRGRVMSIYTMAFMGAMPFGSLLAGAVADKIGATYTITIGGIICIITALVFARYMPKIRKVVHPIYVKMGIIPEIATGIQAATNLTTPPEE
ncbi:MAG: MFS transporter [Candidatus Latescibacteria bacterium]|nr:MFS transporter [Candidatus Latescibacterota bacterium]